MLQAAGAAVHRVGFNRGDQAFWPDRATYIPYRGAPEDWPATLTALLDRHAVTDIVLYGDTRPIHAAAVAAARSRGLTLHVFEEGYLRPYWVTYERGGSNGHSRLMRLSVADMRAALARSTSDQPDAPTAWGDMRQHIFWGALYHWYVFAGSAAYPRFRPHRALTVWQEAKLHLRRLLAQPVHRWERILKTAAIRQSGHPFHLVLLQLEHDASFRTHSPFQTMTEFLAVVMEGFAAGAPPHHHLVFKAHPLEDGRVPLRAEIRRLAAQHGVTQRVHFIPGGKLGPLLNLARSAVTVNSTAGQQVLWRGLPLRTSARRLCQAEFVSDQPRAEFFARPTGRFCAPYRDFGAIFLETSQFRGGFLLGPGAGNCAPVTDMMLSAEDPYDALRLGCAAHRQQLHPAD